MKDLHHSQIYVIKTLKMETFSDFEAVVSAICVIKKLPFTLS